MYCEVANLIKMHPKIVTINSIVKIIFLNLVKTRNILTVGAEDGCHTQDGRHHGSDKAGETTSQVMYE